MSTADIFTFTAKAVDVLGAYERGNAIAEEFFAGIEQLDLNSQSRKKMILGSYIADFLQEETHLAIDQQEDYAIYRALNKLAALEAEGVFEGGAFHDG